MKNIVGNDPTSYSLLTYMWVIGLSSWGGVAGYIRRIKNGNGSYFSIAELVGEIVISGFVGVLTFYLCQSADIVGPLSAALVGTSGHMGSRALFFLEQVLSNKLPKLFGKDLDNI